MTETRIYAVDRYHAGIRLAVLVALFAGLGFGSFAIVPIVTTAIGLTQIPPLCLNLLGGVLIGAGIAWLTEQVLLKAWPSGRKLIVNSDYVEIGSNSANPVRIAWNLPVSAIAWRFVVPKSRTFVPKGWLCLSCRLSQNDQTITLYTFSNPSEAQKLPQWTAFEHLISQKDGAGPGSEHLSAIIAEQGQLRAAERDRWEFGAELSRADFFEFISTVDSRVENWPE
jgi:hypothetical protein